MKAFILADNQDITRCGLLSLLAELGFADSATEACSRDELKQQLDARPNACVVLDYTLFDVSDFQLLNLRERYRLSHWLLFSDELSKHFLRQVLQSGQQFGVVMKSDGRDDIFYALQCASRGETYLCDTARQVLREGVPTRAEHDRLTASEILVLHEIAIGKTTKEIAAEKNLSFHTVNTHRRNIFRKLEINNLHEATKYALRAGIIELAEYAI